MKRWIWLLVILIPVMVLVAAARDSEKKRAAAREASYQRALAVYTDALKPGMNRRQVEEYLENKGVSFNRIYAVQQQATTYDDITKLGEENSPERYCSRLDIFVAFEFYAFEMRDP